MSPRTLVSCLCLLALGTPACPEDTGPIAFDAVTETTVETTAGTLTYSIGRQFPSEDLEQFVGCARASPVRYDGSNGTEVIVADANAVHGVSPETGETLWTVIPAAPDGEDPYIVSTPIVLGDRLFVLYHTTTRPDGAEPGQHRHNLYDYRQRHLVSAIDLASRAVDPDFPPVELDATATDVDGNPVPFLTNNNLGRAMVNHAMGPGETLGTLYLTFGNARDLQPWHGWAFEVSLDTWLSEGAPSAQTGWLVTTPESDCGPNGVSGSTGRICGGGLWAPSGQLIVPAGDSYEIILAPGNGQLDLNRNDYANTLMRVGPGLDFDPGCDPTACADYDPDAPTDACMESCSHLFIPRLLPGQPFPDPGDDTCEGVPLFECWARLDYIGGSTPVYIPLDGGTNVLAYPTKDGHVYLVDADHLGTLYDRQMAAPTCGVPGDSCLWNWSGMIVTQPALSELDGEPLIMVATFMADNTQDGGVVAFTVSDGAEGPRLNRVWEYPKAGTDQAQSLFRKHPGRIRLATHDPGGTELAWILDTSPDNRRLHAIRTDTGEALVQADILGKGYRFTQPLVVDNTVYLPSCATDEGPSFLEAYRLNITVE